MRLTALSICLVLGMLGWPERPAKASAATTTFRLGRHREPLVDVWVNGAGPFAFILDTGSTHSAIAKTLASTLGAPPVAKATITSSLGEQWRPIVQLQHLQIGPAQLTDVLATEMGNEMLSDDATVLGVIGQDVLSSFVYTLDFAHRHVEWNRSLVADSQNGTSLRLRNARGRFLVELPQPQATLWMVPDSGAETMVLFDAPNAPLPPLTRQSEFARLSTVTDQQVVESVHVDRLKVGKANLTHVPAVLVRRDDRDPSLGDGLLPLTMFTRVTFDGPHGLLTVER